MKGFVIGIIVLLVLGVGGYIGLQYFSKVQQPSSTYQTGTIKLVGILSASKGDDYNYVIFSGGKSTGVTSQTLDLSAYVGKTVEVTGQYSGTTLYADTVVPVP